MLEAKDYRIVIFAMMTNIVIDTGSAGHDQASRIELVGECISNNLLSSIFTSYLSPDNKL
jgi:hypothetical protein